MITILGATGYVGRVFSVLLEKRGIAFDGLSRAAIDYSNHAHSPPTCASLFKGQAKNKHSMNQRLAYPKPSSSGSRIKLEG
jgi:aspartate-semialdehyde dehydrogenase